MLAYFPQIYPGELLYSVLARYHLHMGFSSTVSSMQVLFGRRLTIASIDLPGSLRALIDRVPVGVGWTIDRIIDEHTLLPYYVAFQPARVAHQARKVMGEGKTDGLLTQLGMAAFRIGRITQLRFCAACLGEMQARYGEYYWRRDHQLPGVLVCATHGRVLQLSTVSVAEQGRHIYIPATPKNCIRHAPALVHGLLDGSQALWRIAQASCRILESDQAKKPKSLAEWTSYYRECLASAGLLRSAHHADQQRFQEDFRRHHEGILSCVPGLMNAQAFRGDWLATMVRKHRKAFHPLQHILLQDFFDAQKPTFEPFGKGPWPCLNPLSEHHSQAVVASVKVHRNHGHKVGVFVCHCGYVYTRSWFAGAGPVGSPRFQSYGPLFPPVLKGMIDDGLPLRMISRRLVLDPKTVVKLAVELNISVPWKARSVQNRARVAGAVRCCDNRAIQEKGELRSRRPVSSRTDWEAVDLDACRKIQKAAKQLRSVMPPVRVTHAQIERRLWSRGWLRKRALRLPQADACMRNVVESVEQFQQRRAHWIIQQMDLAGEPLQVWRILRKAGLNCSHSGKVARLLSQHFDATRKAA